MLTSWIQGVSVLRNLCAHNSRIYNRTIHTTPEILDVDKITPPPAHNGLYQILLAMKYLRSSDEEWTVFVNAFAIGLNSIQITRDRLVSDGAEFDVLEIKDGVQLYRNDHTGVSE